MDEHRAGRTPVNRSVPQAISPGGVNGSVVLLALSETSNREDALVRASVFARIFDAEIHVLRVVGEPPRPVAQSAENSAEDSFYALRWERTLAMRTWRWCNRRLVTPIRPVQVTVHVGEFLSNVVEVAREMNPVMVIVSGTDIVAGNDVIGMATGTGVPVLVARPVQPGDVVVAATKLANARVPVLRLGVSLGERLGSCVIFMHNVVPVPGADGASPPAAGTPNPMPPRDEVRVRSNVLKAIAVELGGAVEAVVSSESSTPDAILDVAGRAEADLVVVGAYHDAWTDKAFGPGVAARVVESSSRSIMVVPLGEPEEK